MTEAEAAKEVLESVGMLVVGDDEFIIGCVDQIAQEAARAYTGNWGRDCGWRSDPGRAARRITSYLDSYGVDED